MTWRELFLEKKDRSRKTKDPSRLMGKPIFLKIGTFCTKPAPMESPPYSVQIIGAARREMHRIDRSQQERIRAAIRALETEPRPHGYQKMTGSKDLYRIRVGDYRVIYQIQEEKLVILIVRIRHRREAYR